MPALRAGMFAVLLYPVFRTRGACAFGTVLRGAEQETGRNGRDGAAVAGHFRGLQGVLLFRGARTVSGQMVLVGR